MEVLGVRSETTIQTELPRTLTALVEIPKWESDEQLDNLFHQATPHELFKETQLHSYVTDIVKACYISCLPRTLTYLHLCVPDLELMKVGSFPPHLHTLIMQMDIDNGIPIGVPFKKRVHLKKNHIPKGVQFSDGLLPSFLHTFHFLGGPGFGDSPSFTTLTLPRGLRVLKLQSVSMTSSHDFLPPQLEKLTLGNFKELYGLFCQLVFPCTLREIKIKHIRANNVTNSLYLNNLVKLLPSSLRSLTLKMDVDTSLFFYSRPSVQSPIFSLPHTLHQLDQLVLSHQLQFRAGEFLTLPLNTALWISVNKKKYEYLRYYPDERRNIHRKPLTESSMDKKREREERDDDMDKGNKTRMKRTSASGN